MNANEVCKKLGITKKALRVYEEANLCRAKRSENNYRDYDDADLLKLRSIQILRELDFSIKNIVDIMDKMDHDSKYELLELLYIQYKTIELKRLEYIKMKSALMKGINSLLSDDTSKEELLNSYINNLDIHSNENIINSIIDKWDFDSLADNYLKHLLFDTAYPVSIREGRHFLATYDENTSIIDIGGGTGYIWWELPFNNLTILDKSVAMLKKAKEQLPLSNIVMGDILDENASQHGKYELVTALFLLHHIDYADQPKAIENILDFVGPSGECIIIDRCFNNSAEQIAYTETCTNEEKINMQTECYPYLEDILPLFEPAGFSCQVKKLHNNVYMIHSKTSYNNSEETF